MINNNENKQYHFDITPHIVKQLGEQLVSDEITALLELIKNSYDADANYVSIEINTVGEYLKDDLFYKGQKGFIVVEDDGFGMSKDTIMKSWLVISYSHKRKFKGANQLTPKGRTPLGDKGLGRLSTQRLANICEIFTNKEKEDGIHIAFDWKDFEKEEILSNVNIQVKTFSPQKKHGTKLILSNINHSEVWTGQNLEKFKGQVSQIISPYKENRPFDVYLTINGIDIDLDKSNEDLRNLAISRFKFKFDGTFLQIKGRTKLTKFIGNSREDFYTFLEVDQGKKFFDFLHSKYSDISYSDHPFFIEFEKTFDFNIDIGNLEVFNGYKASPGPFEGVIDEFSYDNWMATDQNMKDIFGQISQYRDFAQTQAGIKIFRNGFAIKPFGIDGDDWLRLRDAQTTASSYYPLRPANVLGYFAIDEGLNSNLKDKTDREGLISNPYSRNFFTLALFIRDVINRHQTIIRRSYLEFLKTYKTNNNKIKTVTDAFKQLKATKDSSIGIRNDFDNAVSSVQNVINESNKIVKSISLDSMFTTEEEKVAAAKASILMQKLIRIQETLYKLEKIIDKTEYTGEIIDILEPKIMILEEQLTNFSELASLGLTAESISHEFASISDRLSEKATFYANKLKADTLSNSDIYVLVEYINTTVNGLKNQLKHIDPALKYNREKKYSFPLSVFFKDEIEYYKNRFEKQNIDFQIKINSDFSISINKGKLVQIIDNIINNSEYWLIEKIRQEPYFSPNIIIEVDAPWIYIYDNGYGIAPAIENQIFEPFVSTKPKGKGRGLGLFIIQQLLDSIGCTIVLEPKLNKHQRKYIFAINLSNIIV